MGKKYASIHIYDRDQKETIVRLKRHYGNIEPKLSRIMEAADVLKDERILQLIGKMPSLFKDEVLLVQSDAFISLYDESLSFETIEENARMISGITDKPVVYLSNFDDDVFLFGVYRLGQQLTCLKTGEGLSNYEIDSENIDTKQFCEQITVYNKNEMEFINTETDISVIEEKIEELLQVSLKLTQDDVRKDTKHYKQEFIENALKAYKYIGTPC